MNRKPLRPNSGELSTDAVEGPHRADSTSREDPTEFHNVDPALARLDFGDPTMRHGEAGCQSALR